MALFTSLELYVYMGSTWVNVSADVVGPVQVNQGRKTPWGPVDPGELAFQLRDLDGRYMPGNAAGPNTLATDMPVQLRLWRGGSSWIRFRGWVKSWAPSFPTTNPKDCRVQVVAVDALGLAAAQDAPSCWEAGARYWASLYSASWDQWVCTVDGEAAQVLPNVSDGPGTRGSLMTRPAAGGVAPLASATAEGLSVPGGIAVNSDPTGAGATLRLQTGGTIQCLQMWLKFPTEVQGAGSTADVLTFRDEYASAVYGFLLLRDNAGVQSLNIQSAGGSTLLSLKTNPNTDQWFLFTMRMDPANNTRSICSLENGLNEYWYGTVSIDIRNFRSVFIGGMGTDVAKFSVAGISTTAHTDASIPTNDGLAANSTGDLANRTNSWSLIAPTGMSSRVGSAWTDRALTGSWHGKSVLEVGQEVAATGRGVLWHRPCDLTSPRFYGRDVCYPATSLATATGEGHQLGGLTASLGSESQPTRVTVSFPGGSRQVIDSAAEAAREGHRSVTLSTLAASDDVAEAIGEDFLARGASGLQVTKVTVDLEGATSDLVAAFFDETSPTAGLYPTQRVTIGVPASHFGVSTMPVHVQGWTEIYDGIGGCRIELDTSPPMANPPTPPPGTNQPYNAVQIGSFPPLALDGVNPQNSGWGGDLGQPGGRGANQLIVYTNSPVTTTATNQWGFEIAVSSAGLITLVNDRATSGSLTGTAVPSGGYVISGHGAMSDRLRAIATVGASVARVYIYRG